MRGENHRTLHAALDFLKALNEDINGTLQQYNLLPYSHILSTAKYI